MLIIILQIETISLKCIIFKLNCEQLVFSEYLSEHHLVEDTTVYQQADVLKVVTFF